MRSVMRMRVVFYGALGVNRRAVYVRGEQHTLTDGRTTLARPKERAALVRKRARALALWGGPCLSTTERARKLRVSPTCC